MNDSRRDGHEGKKQQLTQSTQRKTKEGSELRGKSVSP
jgi:hypothetical protein